jgi:HEAT repeat protein
MTTNKKLLTLAALTLCGCGDGGKAEPGAAPSSPTPLVLQPMQQKLEAMAATLRRPNQAEQRELQELADIALLRTKVDERAYGRVERALLEHRLAWFGLEAALVDEDPQVRSRAAWLCGRTKQPVLQLPLLMRLKYELDPEAILWVADALFWLGNDAGLGWIEAAMSRDATAERAGSLAIGICRELGLNLSDEPTYAELQGHMQGLTSRWRVQGVGSRQGVRPADPDELRARVAGRLAVTAGTQLRPVDDARFVLTRSGKLTLLELLPSLRAEEPYLRTMVLQVLTEIGPPAQETGQQIAQLLQDPLTCAYAIRALGRIGYQPAATQLRPMLDSVDIELRAAAAGTLGLLRDETSRTQLESLLADEEQPTDVRVQAAFGLAALGDDGAGKAYLQARKERGDYHGPMLERLLEELVARGH